VEGETFHAILFAFCFGGVAAETKSEQKILGDLRPRSPAWRTLT